MLGHEVGAAVLVAVVEEVVEFVVEWVGWKLWGGIGCRGRWYWYSFFGRGGGAEGKGL